MTTVAWPSQFRWFSSTRSAINGRYEQNVSVVSANAGHNYEGASGSPLFAHLAAPFPADFEIVTLFGYTLWRDSSALKVKICGGR